ncbi:MAG TPA: hypothetical protein VMS22_05330 [Candidatus Eisenbacteria bacterium]|nr:hypothetical protein [Candidatus Eisenbacteria bacterium]
MPKDDAHERASRVFVPDALLPTQYFDRVRRRKDLTGEQRLMFAVLELGIEDYMKYLTPADRRTRELFAGAERWIESEDRSWLCAFETICHCLSLDADYVRHGLRRLKARARGGVAPTAPARDVVESPVRRRASNE